MTTLLFCMYVIASLVVIAPIPQQLGKRDEVQGDGTTDSAGLHPRETGGLAPVNAKHTAMSDETRLERRLDRALARATTPRGAAIVIAAATISITVATGILMTVLDRENYPTIGSGLWWAVQTTTTVGYGDHVPTTVAGQLLAAFVMLVGIGFLTVITAAITSTFVARARLEQTRSSAGAPKAEELRQIDKRLERIEAALTDSS